jgi:hypothetical protein
LSAAEPETLMWMTKYVDDKDSLEAASETNSAGEATLNIQESAKNGLISWQQRGRPLLFTNAFGKC